MTAQVIHLPLSVVGFASTFTGAPGIDNVATALYVGTRLTLPEGDMPVTDAAPAVLDLIDEVLRANALVSDQVVVLLIGTFSEPLSTLIKQQHVQTESTRTLTEALIRASAITKKGALNTRRVLIIAMSDIDEALDAPANISFSRDFSHYSKRQGAACVLLMNTQVALESACTCYATLDNMAWGSRDNIENIITTSLRHNDLNSRDICTLEVSACSQTSLRDAEQQGILQAYQHTEKMHTAISCQKSVLGDNADLSQLMALMHSALALYQRYRPAIVNWDGPIDNALAAWQDSPFYFLAKAAPVFSNEADKVRHNALSLLDETQYTHLIMSAHEDGLVHQNGFNSHLPNRLFIISADNVDALIDKLKTLDTSSALNQLASFNALAGELYSRYQLQKQRYTLVLIADSMAQLSAEKALALRGIGQAFINKTPWKTPKGSYFSSTPDENANVAFLYPGIGATYIGFGTLLLQMFPEIYPNVLALSSNISEALKDRLLNPRSICALSVAELNKLDLDLRNELANIAEAGVGYACVLTAIFEQVLQVKATHACGYSMGEVSMFAALGCWQRPGDMSARLAHSDTFNHQLSNELRSVRKLWKLSDSIDEKAAPIWETYAIKGNHAQVSAAINASDRVYITIINTPSSLLIAGFPEHCLALCKRLGVRAIALNMTNAIHCAPATLQYDEMLALYSMPVNARISTKMLSSSCYLPIPQHQKAISISIAKGLCSPVDFPRLINTLAKKDVNVYIEMGAGRSLSGWTDKILKEQTQSAHISVPVNVKGTDQHLTLLRAVAKLLSFGVTLNIDRFFSGSLIK
ncbi:polyunsaturated fatty acid synthase PfaB [Psychromonas sp. CNPT3]|uniref:PfaB family protein n=1 Tax=Psychromonas sp. CNPT3 TaxID=314282 RepID=UPI00006E2D20|nr:PfaB family protein [Psychromonas sp. CNPT3]AGH81295.1 polyunsaturated fatty acid synthase PfaB [Psychromonas sp. CNPT3]